MAQLGSLEKIRVGDKSSELTYKCKCLLADIVHYMCKSAIQICENNISRGYRGEKRFSKKAALLWGVTH